MNIIKVTRTKKGGTELFIEKNTSAADVMGVILGLVNALNVIDISVDEVITEIKNAFEGDRISNIIGTKKGEK